MSEFCGREYNYEVWAHSGGERVVFKKQIAPAGDQAPDFTLTTLEGEEIILSSLRGLPVMLEFGSIT